MVNRPHHPTAA